MLQVEFRVTEVFFGFPNKEKDCFLISSWSALTVAQKKLVESESL